VYRLRKTENHETGHIRSVHSGVSQILHLVHITPPPRPRPFYGTDVESLASHLFTFLFIFILIILFFFVLHIIRTDVVVS
jgi:hypothetical protein